MTTVPTAVVRSRSTAPITERANRRRREGRSGGAGRRPPGPSALAIPRSLRAFQRNAPELMLDLRRVYGDLVRLPLGYFVTNLVCHPDAIRYVLQDNNSNYVRGKGYDAFKPFMGSGLLTTDGAEWRAQRRTVNPLFHHAALASMESAMTKATTRVLDQWERRSDRSLDVVPEMMDITLGALGEVMFDTDLAPDRPRVGPAMATAIEAMVFRGTWPQLLRPPLPTRYNKNIRDAREVLYEIVARIVEEHRNGSHAERIDLVRLLLETRDADTDQPMTPIQIRDQIMTIFMAGHETSGTGLALALWELANNPDEQERLHSDLEAAFSGATPTLRQLASVPRVQMVIDESLRLHPPIWVYPRDAVEDDVIDGWRIPAGQSVFLIPFVTHRHPDFWVEPNRFDPERFSADAPPRPKYAYFPFGGGQRKCIGSQMALQQLSLSLAMIVQRFRLAPAPGASVEEATLVSLRPPAGCRLTLEPRQR